MNDEQRLPHFQTDLTFFASCPRCRVNQQVTAPAAPALITCIRCRALYLASPDQPADFSIKGDRTRPRPKAR